MSNISKSKWIYFWYASWNSYKNRFVKIIEKYRKKKINVKVSINNVYSMTRIFFRIKSEFFPKRSLLGPWTYWLKSLTLQGQLSLQGTFRLWTDVKVLWTKADEGDLSLAGYASALSLESWMTIWSFEGPFVQLSPPKVFKLNQDNSGWRL